MKGDTALNVARSADGFSFARGDLISIEGGGVSEIRNVIAVAAVSSNESTITVGAPVGIAVNPPHIYLPGSVVRKFQPAITVYASSPGGWGNRIKLEVEPIDQGNSVIHFSLRVTVDQGLDPVQPQQQEFYPLLSLDPDDPSPSKVYAPDVVNPVSQLIQICPATRSQGTFLLVNAGPACKAVICTWRADRMACRKRQPLHSPHPLLIPVRSRQRRHHPSRRSHILHLLMSLKRISRMHSTSSA